MRKSEVLKDESRLWTTQKMWCESRYNIGSNEKRKNASFQP